MDKIVEMSCEELMVAWARMVASAWPKLIRSEIVQTKPIKTAIKY